MIKETSIKRYCNGDFTKIENYDKAVTDDNKWHIHHRLETHKYKDRKRTEWIERDEQVPSSVLRDLGLYYNRPAEELIFLTGFEHISLHSKYYSKRPCSSEQKKRQSEKMKGHTVSEETRQKIRETLKGNIPWNKGKTGVSEETRKKMSEAAKARGPNRKGRIGEYHHSAEIREKIAEASRQMWKKRKG